MPAITETEARVRALIADIAPEQAKPAAAARKWLRARLPGAHEIVYEYSNAVVLSYAADGRGYEAAVGLRVCADGLQLYLHGGKELPDPAKLLAGSGKLVRSLELESLATFKRPEVVALIEAAIARSPVPYAASGPGETVIRPTAAGKRRKA